MGAVKFYKSTLALGLLLYMLLLTACAGESTDSNPSGQEAAGTQNPSYEARGLVVSIPESRNFVQIDHETIPGFMEAMTMVFPVQDSVLLSGVAAGDSVSFMLQTSDIGQLFVTQLTPY